MKELSAKLRLKSGIFSAAAMAVYLLSASAIDSAAQLQNPDTNSTTNMTVSKSPRFMAAADYFDLRTAVSSKNSTTTDLLSGSDSATHGRLYGGTVGLYFGEDTDPDLGFGRDLLMFSYRQGTLNGQANYTSGALSDVKSKLVEDQVDFRQSFHNIYAGLSFLYQDWDSRETFLPPNPPITDSFNNRAYSGLLILGGGHVWNPVHRFDLGFRLEGGLGGGATTGASVAGGTRIPHETFVLLQGTAVVSAGYRFLRRPVGLIFVEGGGKVSYYGASQDDSYLSETLFGPYFRAGLRFDF